MDQVSAVLASVQKQKIKSLLTDHVTTVTTVQTDPLQTDPVKTDSVTTDPVKTVTTFTTDPVKTDSVTTDPVKTDTVQKKKPKCPFPQPINFKARGRIETDEEKTIRLSLKIHEIVPGVLMTSADGLKSSNEHFPNILSLVAVDPRPNCNHMILPFHDEPDPKKMDVSVYFDKTHNFIAKALAKNEKVLVHCHMGISRSATIVISYIMKTQKMGWIDALHFVSKKRPIICPNQGFMYSLMDYEKKLRSLQTDPVQTDPLQTDPVKSDLVQTDPVQTDLVKTDPLQTDPLQTDL